MFRLVFFLIISFGGLFALPVHSATVSSSLYAAAEQSIYQIQVVNRKTSNKSTSGSGFLIEREDILATNYHVVSEYINDPDVFSLEFLSTTGKTGPLELVDFDIVHDLAVVKALSHRVLVMRHGELVEQGDCHALFSSPENAYTRQLLDAAYFYQDEQKSLSSSTTNEA